jgi:hypothetical protein
MSEMGLILDRVSRLYRPADFRFSPKATEMLIAAKWRDVPICDINRSAHRRSPTLQAARQYLASSPFLDL